jgi:hypothetical protein
MATLIRGHAMALLYLQSYPKLEKLAFLFAEPLDLELFAISHSQI